MCGIRRGPGDYYYRRRTRLAPPGGVTVFEPGEVHVTRRVYEPANFSVLFITTDSIREWAMDVGLRHGPPHFHSVQLDRLDLYHSLRRLADSIETPSSALEQQTRMTLFLHSLFRVAAEESPQMQSLRDEPVAVGRARALIQDRLKDNITLDELAREGRLSRFQLVRAFRHAVGMAPHQYQVQARLARARSLLSQGISIAEAASEAGFFDQSHLHRHFRASFGSTPGDFIRHLK